MAQSCKGSFDSGYASHSRSITSAQDDKDEKSEMIQTLEWTDQGVRFIDQTKLPTEETYVTCKSYEQVADAIRTMVVRGAPAIGVAAAMGIAIGVQNSKAETVADLKRDLDHICDVIGKTRPTAVNLFWAIRRMQEKFERIRIRPIAQIKRELVEEAKRMHAEDIAANQAMGRHGATLMPSEGGVLTHCNAGALATAGYGTALGVIRAAVEQGKKFTSMPTKPGRFCKARGSPPGS